MTLGIQDALNDELPQEWWNALAETEWEANELHAKHQAQLAMDAAAKEMGGTICGG